MALRYHYSSQPGGRGGNRYRRPNRVYGGAEEQSAVTLGGRMNLPAERVQARLDKWQAGADEIEAAMIPWRTKKHAFAQMGSLPSCEKCGMARGFQHDGKMIHFSA